MSNIKYFNLRDGSYRIRFLPSCHEDSKSIIPIKSHWIDRTRSYCSGDSYCAFCAKRMAPRSTYLTATLISSKVMTSELRLIELPDIPFFKIRELLKHKDNADFDSLTHGYEFTVTKSKELRPNRSYASNVWDVLALTHRRCSVPKYILEMFERKACPNLRQIVDAQLSRSKSQYVRTPGPIREVTNVSDIKPAFRNFINS